MGLSSKQVSSSTGLDWNKTLLQSQNLELPKPVPPSMKKQQQQQQSHQPAEPLKCPRCDSINTKFCYYNNYNKSQPRHFCRACKRHWTKGGTLRNVPVGGGRKNKRAKKSTTTTTTTSSISTTTTSNGNMKVPPLGLNDQKSMPSSLYQSMIHSAPLLPQQNLMSVRDSEVKDFGGGGDGMLLSSSMTLPQSQGLLFPFSTSSSFDANPCSVSASNVYSYGEEFKTMEEPEPEPQPEPTMVTSIMPSTSGGANTQLWEIPATSTAMEMSNYWGWEDLDSLVSTDLNVPWDDSDIKP